MAQQRLVFIFIFAFLAANCMAQDDPAVGRQPMVLRSLQPTVNQGDWHETRDGFKRIYTNEFAPSNSVPATNQESLAVPQYQAPPPQYQAPSQYQAPINQQYQVPQQQPDVRAPLPLPADQQPAAPSGETLETFNNGSSVSYPSNQPLPAPDASQQQYQPAPEQYQTGARPRVHQAVVYTPQQQQYGPQQAYYGQQQAYYGQQQGYYGQQQGYYGQQAAAPAYYPVAANPFGGLQCFSGDMMVETTEGPKRMDEITVGDSIMSMHDNSITYSPVVMWLHKKDQEEATFKAVKTASGRLIKLTDFHIIYVTECGLLKPLEAVHAQDLKVGQCLVAVSESLQSMQDRIVSITEVTEKGIYAPLTSTGNLMVNRLLASSHSNMNVHSLQQTFFQAYSQVSGAVTSAKEWFGFSETIATGDIPFGIRYLVSVIDMIVPKF